MKTRAIFLISLFLFAANSWGLTDLTLRMAIEEAETHSTPTLKATNDVKLAEATHTQSYWQFGPNLAAGAQGDYAWGTTYSVLSTPYLINSAGNDASFNASTTINLFNGFGDTALLRSTGEMESAKKLTLKRARQQAAMTGIQFFFQAAVDEKIVDVAQSNLKVSQDRLALFTREADVGQITSADLFRQQALTANDEVAFIQAKTRAHTDLLTVVQQLRLDPNVFYRIVPPRFENELTPAAGLKAEDLISTAFVERDDWKSYGHQTSAFQDNIQQAQSQFYPLLNLSFQAVGAGRYLHSNFANGVSALPPSQTDLLTQVGNQIVYTVALNLSWNIFDRDVTGLNVEKAMLESDNLQVDKEDLRLQIINDVKRVLLTYTDAADAYQAAQKGFDAATKAFAVIEGRYKVGSANFIDLASAQNQLVSSQVGLIRAIYNLRLQKDTLNFITGKEPE